MFCKTAIRKIYNTLPFKVPLPLNIYLLARDRLRLLNKKKTVVKEINGITYELQLNQLIDSSIYYDGCFEPNTVSCIKKLCKEGMTVIDIGANIGCHTLLFAKIVGDSGKVIAFEPMEWALKKLRRNINLNNIDNNIIVEKMALSNKKEIKELLFKSSWTIDSKKLPESQIPQKINMETLDEYVSSNGIEHIDLIKLDVDGYEFKVLKGAFKTLKTHKPVIITEIGFYSLERVGDKAEDMLSLLESIGYQSYSEKNLIPYESVDKVLNSIPHGATINIVLMNGINRF
jgi:FkbM family methyltransferase